MRLFSFRLIMCFTQASTKGAHPFFSDRSLQPNDILILNGKDLTHETFVYLSREGWPFVVRGWWNVSENVHSCRAIACAFPEAQARAEYTGGSWVSLGEVGCQYSAPQTVSWEGFENLTVPYVWHAKDEATREEKESFMRFLPSSPLLSSLQDVHFRDSAELWLQPEGSGALAHADGYCSGVLSVQLSGRKEWKLMAPPNFQVLADEWFDDTDGGIYKTGDHTTRFVPDWSTILNPGDAIFFPPGIIHETRSLGKTVDENLSPSCTTSVTGLLRSPWPAGWIKRFLPGVSILGDGYRCMNLWKKFAADAVANSTSEAEVRRRAASPELINASPLWALGFDAGFIKDTIEIRSEISRIFVDDVMRFLDWDQGVERFERNLARSRFVAVAKLGDPETFRDRLSVIDEMDL